MRESKHELATLLRKASVYVESETIQDYNENRINHDVTFFAANSDLARISLRKQHEYEQIVRELLNIAGSRAKDESVSSVHFELLDNDIRQKVPLISPRKPKLAAVDLDRIWGHERTIKLFISHRDADKAEVAKLKEELLYHKVSCFVAHRDIEHDKEWQKEIEKALGSMHLMLAFITDKFFESVWTNQELGYALGSGVDIIKIKASPKADPKGFLSSRQAMRWSTQSIGENTRRIWTEVKKYLQGQPSLGEALLARFESSPTYREAENRFEDIQEALIPDSRQIARMIRAYNVNSQISEAHGINFDESFLKFINKYSDVTYVVDGTKVIEEQLKLNSAGFDLDDEIPF